MPKKVEIDFPMDFEGTVSLPIPLGRLDFNGHACRLVFTQEGKLELYCSPGARKHIHFAKPPIDPLGFTT